MELRRIAFTTTAVAAIIGVGLATFVVMRSLGRDEPVTAAPQAPATPSGTTASPIPPIPGFEVTPEPGATPDRTQPWWHIPYLNADRDKPLFDGTLAGIRIGNGVTGAWYICRSPGEVVEISEAATTTLSVSPSYLPDGTLLSFGECLPLRREDRVR